MDGKSRFSYSVSPPLPTPERDGSGFPSRDPSTDSQPKKTSPKPDSLRNFSVQINADETRLDIESNSLTPELSQESRQTKDRSSKGFFQKIRYSLDFFSLESDITAPKHLSAESSNSPRITISTEKSPNESLIKPIAPKNGSLKAAKSYKKSIENPIRVRKPISRSNSKLRKATSTRQIRFAKKNEAKLLSSAKWHSSFKPSNLRRETLDVIKSTRSSDKNSPRLNRAGGKKYAKFRSRANSFSDQENDHDQEANLAYGLQKDLEYAIPIAMRMIGESNNNSNYHSRAGSIIVQDLENYEKNISNSSSLKNYSLNLSEGHSYKINRGSTGLEPHNFPDLYNGKFLDPDKNLKNEKSHSSNAYSPNHFDSNVPSGFITPEPSEFYKKIHSVSVNRRFLTKVCYSLGSYGSPSYRMETTLPRMANFLKIKAKFMTFPSFVLIFFEESKDQSSKTEIVTTSPAYNLHKLDLTDALFEDVMSSKIPVEDALKEIRVITKMHKLYPRWVTFLFNCLGSMAISIVAYSGGWSEMWISFLMGIIVNASSFFSIRYLGFKKLHIFTSSLLVGFIATSLKNYACFGSVTLSALFYLLPGLELTVGIMELVAGSLIIGTVKVFRSLVITLTLSFSAQVGSTLFNTIFKGSSSLSSTIDLDGCVPCNRIWILLFFPICMSSVFVFLNTPFKRMPICMALATAMYGVFWVLNNVANLDYFATVTASFVIGIFSNLCGKFLEIPPFIPLLPAVIMLVPGSIGVRSLSALLGGEPVTDLLLRMITSCLSIMMGLFASAFFIFPSGKNNTALLTF
ncbi:Pheromone-regulated membrane protein 10 [Smittium mucronatum]|uniref:Pheromone-regulated membrane protein 10 n=1 Tax=Smittium mucronatum TaxID=133383 RepID=A0A1R0GTC6_9FUNG|nr:Pheromone-regulated membrane protein 10 [Smittium mucronatum]